MGARGSAGAVRAPSSSRSPTSSPTTATAVLATGPCPCAVGAGPLGSACSSPGPCLPSLALACGPGLPPVGPSWVLWPHSSTVRGKDEDPPRFPGGALCRPSSSPLLFRKGLLCSLLALSALGAGDGCLGAGRSWGDTWAPCPTLLACLSVLWLLPLGELGPGGAGPQRRPGEAETGPGPGPQGGRGETRPKAERKVEWVGRGTEKRGGQESGSDKGIVSFSRRHSHPVFTEVPRGGGPAPGCSAGK